MFAPPKGWIKKEMTIPICQPCKKAAVRKHRKQMAIAAAVWIPVSWGALLLLVFTGALWKIIEILGFPWGLLPPLVLGGTPLYALYLLIRAFLPPAVGPWPVLIEEKRVHNNLIFENETYVKKFITANTEKLSTVVDYGASPPKYLMKEGQVLM